jgi:hypothetical protein
MPKEYWQEMPRKRSPKDVSVYAPKRAIEFSPGFQPRETPPLVFYPEGVWEIEPVDLRFYNQSVK